MNIRRLINIKLLLVVCFVFLLTTLGYARSLNDIKQSMAKRAPVINALKSQGVVGENNKGYLGFVGNAKAREDVIAAENKDRKTIYTFFAKQQKTSLSVVESVQGKRKAERAKPGEFFQAADGSWMKK